MIDSSSSEDDTDDYNDDSGSGGKKSRSSNSNYKGTPNGILVFKFRNWQNFCFKCKKVSINFFKRAYKG